MINYLKSELYRNLRNKNLLITIVVFIALCIVLIASLSFMGKNTPNFPYGNTRFAVGSIYMEMSVMLVVALFLSFIIDDNENKNQTIKHSVSFGIRRTTIYISRFIAQAIISVLIFAAMASLLAVLSYIFLPHSNVGEYVLLLRVCIGGLTSLLATLAAAYMFITNMENATSAMIFPILITYIMPAACNIIGRKVTFVAEFAKVLPYNLIASDSLLVTATKNVGTVVIQTSIIGIIWLLFFLISGTLWFKNKEIK